jgi:hypothetical protein
LGPETATTGQEKRQRGKEDNETDGEGVYRMLLSGLMVADGSGIAGNRIRHACGGRQGGLDDRESIGGGSLKGAERKARAHVLTVAGDGEQRWEGDEGGSGSDRSQPQRLCQCQSVKFLMASDLGVERKSPTL